MTHAYAEALKIRAYITQHNRFGKHFTVRLDDLSDFYAEII